MKKSYTEIWSVILWNNTILFSLWLDSIFHHICYSVRSWGTCWTFTVNTSYHKWKVVIVTGYAVSISMRVWMMAIYFGDLVFSSDLCLPFYLENFPLHWARFSFYEWICIRFYGMYYHTCILSDAKMCNSFYRICSIFCLVVFAICLVFQFRFFSLESMTTFAV